MPVVVYNNTILHQLSHCFMSNIFMSENYLLLMFWRFPQSKPGMSSVSKCVSLCVNCKSNTTGVKSAELCLEGRNRREERATRGREGGSRELRESLSKHGCIRGSKLHNWSDSAGCLVKGTLWAVFFMKLREKAHWISPKRGSGSCFVRMLGYADGSQSSRSPGTKVNSC